VNNNTNYYRDLHKNLSIPEPHIQYLKRIDYTPKVVFDIGAAVLHWTKEAKLVWPDAKYYAFEGVMQVKEFYDEYGIDYGLGLLSDEDGREVTYYCHPIYLGGNSYYKENEAYSAAASDIYTKEFEENRITFTLDTIVKNSNFPAPDLLKIDVQGAELDILKGAPETLKSVQHLIIELQHVEYNIGAKQVGESIPYIESLGFELVPTGVAETYFCGNGPDCDYHFKRK
jgi:FkbM family methyltransferase